MRFTCDTNTLLNVCVNIERCIPAKGPLPHLECIYMKSVGENEIQLCGYDLEMGIISKLKVNLEEGGALVLNAKTFLNMLKQIPGDIVYVGSDSDMHVTVKCADVEYTMMSLDTDGYPEIPSVTEGTELKIGQQQISDIIRQTIFAVSIDETKAAHRGIRFEITPGEMKLVALDGFRMAIRKCFINYNGENLLFVSPTKILNEIMKLATEPESYLTLVKGKRFILVTVGSYTLISKLLEGEFLDYNRAMPTGRNTVVRADTKEMTECIDRIAIIITDKLRSPLRVKIENDEIQMSTVTPLGSANAAMNCSLDGAPIEIGFNNRFLSEALRFCEKKEILINFNGALSPVTIVPVDGDEFIYLVLPVRL